jgi:two-component system sensor histidine kinase QseC
MKNPSLKRRLVITILMSFVLACLAANAVSLYQIRKSIGEVFDTQLLYFARRIASLDMKDLVDAGATRYIIGDQPETVEKHLFIEDDALTFAIFSTAGRMLLSDGEDSKNFIFNPNVLGAAEGVFIEETRKYKIVWMLSQDRKFVIAAGQEKDYVDDVIHDTLQIQALTWLFVLPVVMVITVFLIYDGLRPIQRLSDLLRQRNAEEVSPMDGAAFPRELRPFVEALNSLFAKVKNLIARERRFTSNAAHELKTPLAALRIQAEVAQLSKDDAAGLANALNNILAGVDRSTRLVEQILTLSRIESLEDLKDAEEIDWAGLVDSVIGELAPAAGEKNMRIEFNAGRECKRIRGAPFAISLMLRNILDNAIKYNDDGVLVRIELGYDALSIEDDGKGVPQEILENIGDRFYRPAGQKQSGSGLGFSIIRQIAHLHGFTLSFHNVRSGGFRIVVGF